MVLRKRIGVMVPSTNTTCEADFQLVAPKTVTIHGQRLWLTQEVETNESSMTRMNSEIESGARYLATAKVDVIAYGCTTGSFFKGPGYDKEIVGLIEGTARVPAVATSPAAIAALRLFKAKKVSVATPYPDWNNVKLGAYLKALGFDVLNIDGDPRGAGAGNQGINDLEPDSVVEFASRACRPEADALFCSCTAWRAVEAADELEKLTGRPVVTSNQATIWAALRKTGVTDPIAGFGRLLEMPADTVSS